VKQRRRKNPRGVNYHLKKKNETEKISETPTQLRMKEIGVKGRSGRGNRLNAKKFDGCGSPRTGWGNRPTGGREETLADGGGHGRPWGETSSGGELGIRWRGG